MTYTQLLECFSKNSILKNANEKNIRAAFENDSFFDAEYHAGEIILSPNSSIRSVGLILRGKVVAEPCGGDAMLRVLCADDMFGIANLYADNEPFPSIIRAKTSANILFLDAERFKWLIESDSSALRAYLSFMSKKIVYLNKKISTLTAGSAEKKLALFISENQCDGQYICDISMSSLAEMLSVGRASLYRAMDMLEQSGIIIRDGKFISIKDINALMNI